MSEYNSLSSRIKYIIMEYDLSMRHLGELAGVSGQTIKNIIEGADTSISVLLNISTKLELSYPWLTTGLGIPPKKGEKYVIEESSQDYRQQIEDYKTKLAIRDARIADLEQKFELQTKLIQAYEIQIENLKSKEDKKNVG
jgi:transcriptional regulator with XRE-family HTH domain